MGEIPEQLKGKTFKDNPDNINRTGLNRGVRWSKNVIAEHLQTIIKHKNDLTGEDEEKQVYDHIILKAIKKALDGDSRALKEVLDRLEGTSIQNVDHTTLGEKIDGTPLLSFVKNSEEITPDEPTSKD